MPKRISVEDCSGVAAAWSNEKTVTDPVKLGSDATKARLQSGLSGREEPSLKIMVDDSPMPSFTVRTWPMVNGLPPAVPPPPAAACWQPASSGR